MDRFWSKVDKSGDCWIWKAGRDDAGYGQFRFNGKNIKAHRVAYYLTHGEWPRTIKHTCDTPACVNPDHLIGGTNPDISQEDKPLKNRRKLSDEEVEEIRRQVAQPYWGQQVILANRYGVSRNIIQRIQYETY